MPEMVWGAILRGRLHLSLFLCFCIWIIYVTSAPIRLHCFFDVFYSDYAEWLRNNTITVDSVNVGYIWPSQCHCELAVTANILSYMVVFLYVTRVTSIQIIGEVRNDRIIHMLDQKQWYRVLSRYLHVDSSCRLFLESRSVIKINCRVSTRFLFHADRMSIRGVDVWMVLAKWHGCQESALGNCQICKHVTTLMDGRRE